MHFRVLKLIIPRITPNSIFLLVSYNTDIFIIRRGINFKLTLPNCVIIYPYEKIRFYYIIIKEFQFGYRCKNVIKNIKPIWKNIWIFLINENINNISFVLFGDNLDANRTDLQRIILVFLNIKFIRLLQFLVEKLFFKP